MDEVNRVRQRHPKPSVAGVLQRYGWLGALRLAIDLWHTRLLFPGARLVRRPIYIRGKRHVAIGANFTAGVGNRLDAFDFEPPPGPILKIGRNVEINDRVHIAAVREVVIGDDVLLASNIFISDHDHGSFREAWPEDSPDVPPAERPLRVAPVSIGDRVWLGEGVQVLPGVSIGAGSVVGAGAIVTRSLPPDCVAVGAPARVIKRYDRSAGRWVAA